MLARLLLPVVALGCAACSTTVFTVQRRAPAEINVPASKPMAVARVDGEGGDALVAELTEALVKTQRFKLVERQNIQAAVGELQFSAAGYVSDDTAISFGEMTGAQALVVGRVLDSVYREVVSSVPDKCARDGQSVDCTRHTRRAEARLNVALEVVETETGHVLAARTFDAARERSVDAYDSEPAELALKEEFFGACRSEIVERFVKMIAPHDVVERVVLRTDGDLPELESGNNYAKIGSWGLAVEQYRKAAARATAGPFEPEQRAAARYNLGIGLAYSAAFDEGIAELEAAYALDPDAMIQQQLEAVRRFKVEAARVAEQER